MSVSKGYYFFGIGGKDESQVIDFGQQSSTTFRLGWPPAMRLQASRLRIQGHKVTLTRMLIGTKACSLESQAWFSEPGMWRPGLIVCSYPEPVRMMRCQDFCNQQQQVSVSSSSGESPRCRERGKRGRWMRE